MGMSLVCKKCKKTVVSAYVRLKCKNSFHPGCAKPESVSFEGDSLVCCTNCRKQLLGIPVRSRSCSPLSSSSSVSPTCSLVANTDIAMASQTDLQAIMARINEIAVSVSTLPVIQGDIAELKELKGTVDDMSRKMGDVIAAVEANRARVDKVEETVKEMKAKVDMGHEKLNLRISRQFWDQEVAVGGLDDKLLQNPLETVARMSTSLGITAFDKRDIAKLVVTRPGQNRKKTLIVRFISPITRDEWITAKRKKRDLTLNDIVPQSGNGKVYINERSSQTERLLLSQGKIFARDNGYKYCWMRRGRVFIKKQDGDASIPYPLNANDATRNSRSSSRNDKASSSQA